MKKENKEHPPALEEIHPNRDELARRAYQLYQARGGEPGHELEDWLQAEREINKHGQVSIAADGERLGMTGGGTDDRQ